MAIAILEAEGRLSLDDDVRTYIPELADFGSTITLRHLVHHTGGIRDWPGTLTMAGWNDQDVMPFDQILRMATHQRELNFEPGEAFAYSNTGYNLLAEVVARVTGRSFRDWTEERIFAPLDMRSTHFPYDHTEVVRDRADSYRRAPDGWRGVPSKLAARIAEIYLADVLEQEVVAAASPALDGPAATPWTLTHDDLRMYEGEYVGDELDVRYRLVVVEGTLRARHFRLGDRILRPVAPDRFQAPAFGEIRFVREEGGGVSGFTAHSDRIRGLRFRKVH